MRLLHARTWQLSEFFGEIPPYAILSHTWGQDEVTFEDLKYGRRDSSTSASTKSGFTKVQGCCRQAIEDGFEYVWIDTCCIDKSSSAELSEAINSMFSWYQQARICYAYLSDVSSDVATFTRSRWFGRGWTLQELLAPSTVVFYNIDWALLGSKTGLCNKIADATGIGSDFLRGRPLEEASVAQRMSWAANRQTLRPEDTAYCLLGIFDVNMPMVYGEGTKAFIRLQEEIIKNSRDLSLFAWGFEMPWAATSSIFAPSPREYLHCSHIQHVGWPKNYGSAEAHYFSTNRGLQIHLPIHIHKSTLTVFAILNCGIPGNRSDPLDMLLGLPLPSKNDDHTLLVRHKYSRPVLVYKDTVQAAKFMDVIIEKQVPRGISQARMSVDFRALATKGYTLSQVFPPHAIYEIDPECCYVSLLPAQSTMLVFRQGQSGCFYLHIQGRTTPEICGLLSPISLNDAYLYWRLATSKDLLDALEQEVLRYPSMLVMVDFESRLAAKESPQPGKAVAKYESFASSSTGSLQGNVIMSADRGRRTGRETNSLVSWTIQFLSSDHDMARQDSGMGQTSPVAAIGMMSNEDGSVYQLVARSRKSNVLEGLRRTILGK